MPIYELDKPHFLGTKFYPKGSRIEWDGTPSTAMTPVDSPDAPAKKDKPVKPVAREVVAKRGRNREEPVKSTEDNRDARLVAPEPKPQNPDRLKG